jgi:hypothetical protein
MNAQYRLQIWLGVVALAGIIAAAVIGFIGGVAAPILAQKYNRHQQERDEKYKLYIKYIKTWKEFGQAYQSLAIATFDSKVIDALEAETRKLTPTTDEERKNFRGALETIERGRPSSEHVQQLKENFNTIDFRII